MKIVMKKDPTHGWKPEPGEVFRIKGGDCAYLCIGFPPSHVYSNGVWGASLQSGNVRGFASSKFIPMEPLSGALTVVDRSLMEEGG